MAPEDLRHLREAVDEKLDRLTDVVGDLVEAVKEIDSTLLMCAKQIAEAVSDPEYYSSKPDWQK